MINELEKGGRGRLFRHRSGGAGDAVSVFGDEYLDRSLYALYLP